MSDRFVSVDGVAVPRFLYGTAWKEDETQRLTELALRAGFRGIDTANQRRHYHEAAVGQGISAASDLVARNDLFLQTKFTFRRGQDHRLPYDANAPVAVQVAQSLASSLVHLGTDAIDSYLLHGPTERNGLATADWEAWRAMEDAHDQGRVRLLGVSNFSLEQLRLLCDKARVRPRLSRTGVMRPGTGIVACGNSARQTAFSTKAFRCLPPTARCWQIPKWRRSPDGTAAPSARLCFGSLSRSA